MMREQTTSGEVAQPGWRQRLRNDRIQLARRILPVAIGAGVFFSLFYAGIYLGLNRPWQWGVLTLLAILTTVCYVIAYLLIRQRDLTAAVVLMIAGINLHVVAGPALVEGMIVIGVLVSFLSIMFARLLTGRVENRTVMMISAVALLIGLVLSSYPPFAQASTPLWLRTAIGVVTTTGALSLAGLILELRDERYQRSLSQAEAYAEELATQQATLEERTQELEQRSEELSTLVEVTQAVSSTLDLQEALTVVADQMVDVLKVDGCTISRWDREPDQVVTWIERRRQGHELADEPGTTYDLADYPLTRTVMETQQPAFIRASDPDADPAEVANMEDLKVESLLMLPLVVDNRSIGLIELDQTQYERDFTLDEIRLCEALADQAASAIKNARLFQQTREALKAQRQAYGEISQEAWAEMLQVQRVKGYRYSQGQLIPLEGDSAHEDSGARQSRLDLAELTLPIRVRGRVIGTIKAHKPPGAGEWLPDEIALAETLAEQLSTALESARLHEEAQQRATHEQTLSDMSAQLSRSLDMDTVLQTAVRELGQLLQLDEVSIHTAPPDDSASGETVDAR